MQEHVIRSAREGSLQSKNAGLHSHLQVFVLREYAGLNPQFLGGHLIGTQEQESTSTFDG